MKKNLKTPSTKKVPKGFWVYIAFIVIVIVLLLTDQLDIENLIILLLPIHVLLLIIYFIKMYRIPRKGEVTEQAVYYEGKEFNYNNQSFFPMGYTIYATRGCYVEEWHIVARNNETKRTEKMSFKCNQNSFLNMAFSLMEKTRDETLLPIELTYEPQKEMTFFNYICSISLFTFIPAYIFYLFLYVISFFNGTTNSELNKFAFIILTVIASIIAIILFTVNPYHKLKRYKQITYIHADKDALVVNKRSFRWDEIQKAKLTCGLTDKNVFRKLELTTKHGTAYYEYIQPYTLNIQGMLEKWFYHQLTNRFEPVFIGQNVTYSEYTKYWL